MAFEYCVNFLRRRPAAVSRRAKNTIWWTFLYISGFCEPTLPDYQYISFSGPCGVLETTMTLIFCKIILIFGNNTMLVVIHCRNKKNLGKRKVMESAHSKSRGTKSDSGLPIPTKKQVSLYRKSFEKICIRAPKELAITIKIMMMSLGIR